MTKAALDLLADWVAENARTTAPEERQREAARLAAEFCAYARDAGLGDADLAELEEDIAATLESRMEEALAAAAAREG